MSKNDSIRLSEKHGPNPSLVRCPVCHKETNEIALLGRLKDDAEAPKYIDGELCDDCKKQYITLCEAESPKQLTGRRAYIKRECVREDFRNNDFLLMTIEDFSELLKAGVNHEA